MNDIFISHSALVHILWITNIRLFWEIAENLVFKSTTVFLDVRLTEILGDISHSDPNLVPIMIAGPRKARKKEISLILKFLP